MRTDGLDQLNNRVRQFSLRSKVCETYIGYAALGFALARSAWLHGGGVSRRCTTVVVCTLISVLTAAESSPLTGRTTALLWSPAATHWRGRDGGTAGAVLDTAVRALSGPGWRWPIPSPSRAEVEALSRAGSALNSAVRQRYVRGQDAGAITAAADDVAAAARALGAGQSSGVEHPVLCVGKRNRLVHLRMHPRLHAAMREAAAANGMGFGAWVRDGVAAALGEHQARRPTAETRDGRAVAGRVAGLLVQAAAVAGDAAEAHAAAAADAALADAAARLVRWGSRR